MHFSRFPKLPLVAVVLAGSLSAQTVIHQDSISFTPARQVDTLSLIPVIRDSWEIYDTMGATLDTSLIRLEPVTGIVRWVAPIEGQREVIVRYRALEGLTATMLGPAWRSLPPLGQLASDSVRSSSVPIIKSQPTRSLPTDDQLVTAGSLFRGLTLSTGRGVNLSGGLNIRLQGELTRGVFINGSLTDQNLPIQPEGDTHTLNELDQIRLALTSRRSGVEVGDFILKGQEGRLSSFERKLEGMRIRLQGENWEAESALAGSPGRFRSQHIQGLDGCQGPYSLATHEGSRTLIILPGTEVVYLNGKRLQRGESLDYTMDYATGELSFTPRHTIRSDSRIVVDFEYTDLVYSRTTGYLSTGWHGERSGLTITALTERDNVQSNLEFSLSAEDREHLRGIGDREQEAVISTAIPDSTGSYDLVDGHYVWRGPDQGDHTVSFFNVGGQGRYRRIVAGDRIAYQWVPPEELSQYNASYAPFRILKLPRQQDLVLASWHLQGNSGGQLARVELGVSDVDLNRSSPLDDQDNRATGYAVQLQWKSKPLSLAGRPMSAGVQLDGLGKGNRFQPPGRWDVVEFQRDWDLDSHPEGYNWQTVNLFLEEGGQQRAFAQLGRIEADSVITGRLRWGVTGNDAGRLTGRFTQTLLSRENSERRWQLVDGELQYKFRNLEPFFRYYSEDRQRDSDGGYQVNQVALGVQAGLSGGIRVGLSRERRRDAFQTGLNETANLWRLSFLRSRSRGSRLETTLSFNEKVTNDDRDDLSYLMGNLSLVHRPAGKPWWLDLRYRLERSIAETKAVIYDSVGTGRGQYRYDPVYDTYVPDEAGTFMRYTIPAGEIRPVNTVKARFRIQTDLNRTRLPFGLARDFKEARLILQGRLASVMEKHSLATYAKTSLNDTNAVNVQSRLQLDLALQAQPRRPQYRLRLLRLTRLNRANIGGMDPGTPLGEALEQSSAYLEQLSRHQVAGRKVNLELRLAHEHKDFQSMVSLLRRHDILKWQGKGTVSGTIGKRLTASLTGNWQQETDRELDELRVQTVTYGVGLQRVLGSQGRLRVDLEQLYVAASRQMAIPYLLAEGFPTGKSQRIRASGQFHLSHNLLLTLTIFSRREADRTPFTNANLELRTQF
ncbi:MAG: hypothetical protein JSU77_07890 [Fidelibacterota bacterium]|nr:MAG: hypothetical protein JSU77_07890 [Candidatus Neomarinimicrobiota bacterium]